MDHPALHGWRHRGVGSAVKKDAVNVQAGSPDGVISRPGAVDTQAVSLQAGETAEPVSQDMPKHAPPVRRCQVLTVSDVFQRQLHRAATGIAIAARRGPAQPMMGKVLLVSIDADEVLQRAGYSGFLVGL